MRRSKSNPAKYTRNYRSISQRRMTNDNEADSNANVEKEIQRLRNILKQGEKNLKNEADANKPHDTPPLSSSGSKRKRSSSGNGDSAVATGQDEQYGGILSKDLLDDQDTGYNKNEANDNALIVASKKKKGPKPAVQQLAPQELKQAKQLQKNAARKLKQLETRAAQKEKRKHLYSKLQETALSPESMQLLSSSATLGKKLSKKEMLKKSLQKERAGMELSPEEHDLLYQDRADEPPEMGSGVDSKDGSGLGNVVLQNVAAAELEMATSVNPASKDTSNEESSSSNKSKKKRRKGGDETETGKVEAMKTVSEKPVENEKKSLLQAAAKDDQSEPSGDTTSKLAPASSLAAQMMASLSKLKTEGKEENEKLLKEREEAELKKMLDEEQRFKPSKRYVPSNPIELKTAATLGLSSTANLDKSSYKVRQINRPADVSAIRYDLPVATMEFEVMDAIRNNDVTIICAETGSGKSTQVPQFLYESGLSTITQDGSTEQTACLIGVTQPRRVAAVSTAKRVCYEMGHGDGRYIQNGPHGEGNLVAYQTRYETAGLGSKTHIKLMTDGILLQEIKSDLLLRKYSVIVLDEAHERGLNSDVLIGLLSAALPLRKEAASEEGSSLPPLKLVIMSATLRVEDFTANKDLFPAVTPAIVRVPGRTHPVTIHHSKVTELDNYEEVAFKKICKIHRKLPQGGILVFLTGKQEIVRMVKKLRQFLSSQSTSNQSDGFDDVPLGDDNMPRDMDDEEIDGDIFGSDAQDDFDDMGAAEDEDPKEAGNKTDDTDGIPQHAIVLPLYSLLSSNDQAKVFGGVPEGYRLIVVATNVAETSITIPGVSYVVDSGRQKCRNFNSATGMASFDIMWISKAAADQRAGRAGRTGPGHCYRLYSSSMYSRHMDSFALPEVLTRPLEDVVLAMKAMKISNVAKFPFPTPPDRSQIGAAAKLLANIGCVDLSRVDVDGGDGQVTRLGAAVSKLPLGVRFGKMLLVAAQAGVLDYAIAMVACLSESNPFVHPGQIVADEENRDEDEAETDEVQERERPIKNQRWRHKAGDILAAMLAVGAYTYAGRGAGGTAEKVACRKFCEQNGLHPVIMERIQKMRIHLSRVAKVRLGNADGIAAKTGGILSSMPPPSNLQERLLCQSVTSGLLDHIALLAPLGSIPGNHPLSLRSAYLSCSSNLKDPLFMDRNSVLYSRDSRVLPQWVCYESLIRKTLNDGTVIAVMKNITPVDPSWLGMLAAGSSLLSIGEPLPSPLPVYDQEKDAVVCSALTKFGSRGWEIPSVKVEMFDALQSPQAKNNTHFMTDDSFRWFARFLLEGKIIKELEGLEIMLSDSPAIITRRTPVSKVALLVSSLASEGIDSAAALRNHWTEVDSKFLFPLLKGWIKKEHHAEAKKLWIDAVKKNIRLGRPS